MGVGQAETWPATTLWRSALLLTALFWFNPSPTPALALGIWGLDAFFAYVVCCEALARTTLDGEPVLTAPRGVVEVACVACPPAAMVLTLLLSVLGLAWQGGYIVDPWDDDDDGDA